MFQALVHTLRLPAEDVRILDKCHNKRNLAEYEGDVDVDERLLAELIATAQKVRNALKKLGPIKRSGARPR